MRGTNVVHWTLYDQFLNHLTPDQSSNITSALVQLKNHYLMSVATTLIHFAPSADDRSWLWINLKLRLLSRSSFNYKTYTWNTKDFVFDSTTYTTRSFKFHFVIFLRSCLSYTHFISFIHHRAPVIHIHSHSSCV